ncbi:hypothetical protein [Scytonema sp. NUACC26]|uniref:hypothetical protein n=1 Tax=Scytonema sp. NUACC26 TaxID=3140176 RepID=UPI0038B354B4
MSDLRLGTGNWELGIGNKFPNHPLANPFLSVPVYTFHNNCLEIGRWASIANKEFFSRQALRTIAREGSGLKKGRW